MNHRIVPMVLLVSAAMSVSASLHAQARGPTREVRVSDAMVEKPPPVRDEAKRTRIFAESQAWLERLVGRFELDETRFTVSGAHKRDGTVVCSHISNGPGVQCSMHFLKSETGPSPTLGAERGRESEQLSPDLGTRIAVAKNSPLLFFGINPETLEIQLVIVDPENVAARSGMLAGDVVDFADNWNVCFRVWTHCWMAAAVSAPPGGDIVIKLSKDLWGNGRKHPLPTKSGYTADFEMRLRREKPVDTSGHP